MYKKLLLVFLFIANVILPQTEEELLTPARIFASYDFMGEYSPSMKWIDNGSGYTILERSKEITEGTDLIKYNTQTEEKEILVNAKSLIPNGSENPLKIRSYSWSHNNKYLLIFTNTRRVWRTDTRGDYWILNLEADSLRQLGKGLPSSSLMFAKFSPNNKMIAYVSKNNIYTENIETGEITQLTKDGSNTIINGTFDWVYEEELGLRDGFRWSPDSKQIAFWQLDAKNVNTFYMINDTDSLYSKLIPVQYPKAGTANSAAKVGVVHLTNGNITWMKIEGDPAENYIARMDWAANSSQIYVQHLNRLQNKLNIMLCNSSSGKTQTILTETDGAWIDINDDMLWLEEGKWFTWVSERSGWRHIYLVSRDGKAIKPVTQGEFDVISIDKIDDEAGYIYYTASPENRGERYLYKVELKENGNVEKLTPEENKGSNYYSISSNAKWAVYSFSEFNTPSTTELITLPEHKNVRTFVNNIKLKETLKKLKINKGEFFTIKTKSNIELDGWKILPPNFDSSKKYPVLFYVYSEPGSQTVTNRYGGRMYLFHQMLAQQGYIIMSLDSRGTPAPRGRKWRKSIYRKIGVITSKDQAEGLEAILNKWDYVDKDRVAIWGWSGGGSMTLNMLFRYPELYKTGISVAPVGNLLFYDTIYQERYMGLPKDNMEDYKNSSPVNFAKGLEGNLLLIHGTGDDNVHYQNSEVVINELIKYNKQFRMFAYPNRSHGIYEGYNTSRHHFTMMKNYLLEMVEPGGKDKK